jgi:hypothetical protein
MACLVGFLSIVARPVVVFMRDPSYRCWRPRDVCIQRAKIGLYVTD